MAGTNVSVSLEKDGMKQCNNTKNGAEVLQFSEAG